MGKLNVMIKDFIKCVILGSCISLGIIFIVGIISLLISKFDLKQSLQIVRSTLLIVGPLGMILGAILILKKITKNKIVFLNIKIVFITVTSFRTLKFVNYIFLILR